MKDEEDVQGERTAFRKAWKRGICLAGERSDWGERGCVEEDPRRRAGPDVKSTLLSLTSAMTMAILIASSARAGVCLNLEIGPREPGEAWQLQLSRACSGTTSCC